MPVVQRAVDDANPFCTMMIGARCARGLLAARRFRPSTMCSFTTLTPVPGAKRQRPRSQSRGGARGVSRGSSGGHRKSRRSKPTKPGSKSRLTQTAKPADTATPPTLPRAAKPRAGAAVRQRLPCVFPLHGMDALPEPNQAQKRIAARLFQRPPRFIGTDETEVVPDELPNRMEVRAALLALLVVRWRHLHIHPCAGCRSQCLGCRMLGSHR